MESFSDCESETGLYKKNDAVITLFQKRNDTLFFLHRSTVFDY